MLALGACSEANQQNYVKAAAATGVAVAAVGVNRAITNDCWARCSTGYLCNEESGLCEPGECLPGCEVGSHCVRDVRGMTYCVRDDYVSSRRPQPRDAGAAPPPDASPRDAGAALAADGGKLADAGEPHDGGGAETAAADAGGDASPDAAPASGRGE